MMVMEKICEKVKDEFRCLDINGILIDVLQVKIF